MSQERVERLVRRFRRLYAVLTIVACLGVLSRLSLGFNALELFVPLPFAAVYAGLRLRRDWVVPLTLFLSAIAALTLFLHIVHPVTDGPALVGKVFSGVALLFVGYQFSVFRRSEVRKHFEYRGHLVF
jgi:hypothetical protein